MVWAQVCALCLAGICACNAAMLTSPWPVFVHSGSRRQNPDRRYRDDCWKPSTIKLGLQQVPGAGMDSKAYTPFAKVLKDGFFVVDCAKDLMFHEGDRFGAGKFSYKLGDVSNVSIVHYTDLVSKDDREAMSHEVCFDFCRTIPDMHYFGIIHGRDCYCAPYYKAMAGDRSQCDAVCPGKNVEFCGGKHKSSVFAMHDCQDSVANLASAVAKVRDAKDALLDVADKVESLGALSQKIGDFWQDVSGLLGQPAPANLMQSAKVFAGELEHAAEAAKEMRLEVDAVAIDGQKIVDDSKGVPPVSTYSEMTKIDGLTRSADSMTEKAHQMTESLKDLRQLATPELAKATNASQQYYELTYFVDKKIKSLYTTCGGKEIRKPLINVSMDVCARACDTYPGQCVGFSYFKMHKMKPICFLHSKFETVSYVVKCPSFLQADPNVIQKLQSMFESVEAIGANTNVIGCFGKFSEFPSSIAPQADGKCPGCLKEAQKVCAKR